MKHCGIPTCQGREIKEKKENTILYVLLLEIKAAAESREKRGEEYQMEMLLHN